MKTKDFRKIEKPKLNITVEYIYIESYKSNRQPLYNQIRIRIRIRAHETVHPNARMIST